MREGGEERREGGEERRRSVNIPALYLAGGIVFVQLSRPSIHMLCSSIEREHI
jgi:hypothetical protein